MTKTCFVFCHGWGFDKEYWNELIRCFLPAECIFEGENLIEDKTIEYIGIGHSLGLIKLINLNIRFKALIGIQGFVNFLGSNDLLHRKRVIELKAMRRFFDTDFSKTLNSFYKRCGGLIPNIMNLDMGILREEFDLLSRSFKIPKNIPILVIGAEDDLIVPPDLIMDNFKNLENVEVIFQPTGLHNLGAKDCSLVYKKIMGFLNEIKEKGNSAKI
jgi:pimeloyl-[acyl-carrier protein] methyl ester esterase